MLENTLYYGDNLDILRAHVPPERAVGSYSASWFPESRKDKPSDG